MLYCEEEQLLGEFGRVKAALLANCMDDDTFEAAKETCMVLGGKLSEVRHRQLVCYSNSRDLETDINNNTMKLSFDKKDFETLDLHHVRSNTPCKELSPTPLDKHKSREPSPFRMPPLKLSSGTSTPGGAGAQVQDPHAYFSRPESSQSIYGGRGNKPLDLDTFRAAMEAKQMTDDSPPQRRPPPPPAQLSKSTSGNIVLRSASGALLCRSDGTEAGTSGAMFEQERPGSAMSDMSINIPDLASHSQHSRPASRLGDEVSAAFDHFSEAPLNYSDKDVQQEATRKMVLQEDKSRFYKEKRQEAEEKERAEAVAEMQKLEDLKIMKEKKLEEEKLAFETKQKQEAEKKKRDEELKIAKEKEQKELLEKQKKEEELRLKKEKEEEEARLKKEERRLAREKEEMERKKAKEEAKRKEEEIQRIKKEKEEKAKQAAAEEAKKKEDELRLKKEKKAQAKQKLLDDAKKKEEEQKKKEEDELQRKKEEDLKFKREQEEQERLRAEEAEEEAKKAQTKQEPSETPQLGKLKRRTSATETSGSRAESPVSILKIGGKGSRDSSKGSRDNSKDRRTMSESEDVPAVKPLSRTGSLKKSSSFNKNKSLTEKKKISFDDDVETEPINQAKALFAAIADTTLEAGRQRITRDKPESFKRTEPAEWDPDNDPDNEDELMIILDTPEQSRAEDAPLKSRSQSRSGERSTGFSHLDEFEKRLAEMQDDLEDETSKVSKEPIYAKIAPKKERQDQMTDDGYFINTDDQLPDYEPEEDVGSEYSRKKVSFAQSEERFEFELPKKETAFKSFTKFLAKELPLNFKRDPSLDARLSAAEDPATDVVDLAADKENLPPPVAPRRSRSRSKQRSVSLQRVSSQQSENIAGARSQSLSRTGEDTSARSFLSAMTGGLYDAGSRRHSRPGSRQSSGERSSVMSWSALEDTDQSMVSGDLDNSLLGQLKKLKPKPKQVQQADFDELFARGMAMSAKLEEGDQESKPEKPKTPALTLTTDKVNKDNGIGYAEKVRSFLDDQAKTEMLASEESGGHVSRDRKKHRSKTSRQASEAEAAAKQKSVEERKRSREYSKPEDIKLSPVVKRDLFTGEIISDPVNDALMMKKKIEAAATTTTTLSSLTTTASADLHYQQQPPTLTVTQPRTSRMDTIQSRHTQGLAPSPGKSFLDATTGQEMFGASIEEDAPIVNGLKQDKLTNGHVPMNSVYDAYDTASSGASKKKPALASAQVPSAPILAAREEPADKGIPTQLKPDKLLANEEFYEQLRSSMKEVEASREFESTQEDPESYLKYSHHLGRAEFGTLKKRTSTRPSAATSRDPSGDRINVQRSGDQ